jgi:hypothetical protein
MQTLRRYWSLPNVQRYWSFRVLPARTTIVGCEVLAVPWNFELRNV